MVEFNIHRKPEQEREFFSILQWAGPHWLKLVLLFVVLHMLARRDAGAGIGNRQKAGSKQELIAGKAASSGKQQQAEFSIGQLGRDVRMVEDRPGILPGRD
jgi:hypothetical protein